MGLSTAAGAGLLLVIAFLVLIAILAPELWAFLIVLVILVAIAIGCGGGDGPRSTPSRERTPPGPLWELSAEGLACTIVLELRAPSPPPPPPLVLRRCIYCRDPFRESLARCPRCGAPG
jgi:peptidoglycan/LPS O-acetylase OafA/YrhL